MYIRYVMVDIEADGPCPNLFSMTEFGAIVIDPKKDILSMPRFYGKFLSRDGLKEDPQALLAIAGKRDRSEILFNKDVDTISEGSHGTVMYAFKDWLKAHCYDDFIDENRHPWFISDNNGFDWQFINYYFHKYVGENPFGHSSTNMGSLYKGLNKDMHLNFKHLRKVSHSHHPVADCYGNIEALLTFGEDIRGLVD